MRRNPLGRLVCAALTATGCAGTPLAMAPESSATGQVGYQELSAGAVGCLPAEIEIRHFRDDTSAYNVVSWMATCGDAAVICSLYEDQILSCAPSRHGP